jgi:hypothetical protein
MFNATKRMWIRQLYTSPVSPAWCVSNHRTRRHRVLLLLEQPLMLVQIRAACLHNTVSYQRQLLIFFLATGIFLCSSATTCSSASSVCRSSHCSFVFDTAAPWPLSVGDRWAFQSVSNVTLSCFHSFLSFVWETHTASPRFRLGFLHTNQASMKESDKQDPTQA